MDDKTITALTGMYCFYEKELSSYALEVWDEALAGLDEVDVRAAFQVHVRDPEAGRFLPKPADIIRHLQGTADEAALMAWADVIGSYCATSEAAKKAVDTLGGFIAIRRAPEAENHFLQRRFVELFKAYRHREKEPKLALLANEVLKISAMAGSAIKGPT